MLATKHLNHAISKAFLLVPKNHKDYYKPFRCHADVYDKIILEQNGETIKVHTIQPVVMYIGLAPIYGIPKEEVIKECELGPYEHEYKEKLYNLIDVEIYRILNNLPVKSTTIAALNRFANLRELVMNKLVEMRPGEFVDLRKHVVL